MRECGKLPASEVTGEKKNPFAAGESALIVFKSVIDDDVGDVLASVRREQTDLGKLAAKGDEFSANKTAAFGKRHEGKSHAEITHAHPAQTRIDVVDR